jgi:hypothetical protein
LTTVAKRSFAGGELDPILFIRVDLAKYDTGARTFRNAYVPKSGGWMNRSGFRFITEVKDSTKRVRLIPFEFNSTDQAYILEFGHLYVRIIKDGALLSVGTPAAWDNATAYVVGNIVSFGGDNYYCVAENTNQTPPDTDYWYALDADILELPSPYTEAELTEIQFVQSADVLSLVHQNHRPHDLSRLGQTHWKLEEFPKEIATYMVPSIQSPVDATMTVSGTAGNTTLWSVTTIKESNREESIFANSVGSNAAPTSGAPITIGWDPVVGAYGYNVYRNVNGVWAYIGFTRDTQFVDSGLDPDLTESMPEARLELVNSGQPSYPGAITYFQQRLILGNLFNNPEAVFASRTGAFKNFTRKIPITSDDSLFFRMAGRKVNTVRHLLDLGSLIVFTNAGEWIVRGDSAGILRPGEINPKQYSYNGSSHLSPIVINSNALYVQAEGSIVRDLGFDIGGGGADGFVDGDLTAFSGHLFEDKSIVAWTYSKTPHSIVYAANSLGEMLGLTYLREQQIFGWHRHDTDGLFEDLCAIPEAGRHATYAVVQREIGGVTKRCIERSEPRLTSYNESNIIDAFFVDSGLTYDGRNTNPAHTMTLSGGTNWDDDELLNATSSTGYFDAGDVGNELQLFDANGKIFRLGIEEYTSATVVKVRPKKTVPVALRNSAQSRWTFAVNELEGLDHLEGKAVSVLADGFVVACPHDSDLAEVVVTSGAITLEKPYGVIHVGLPYISDLETLDIDTVQAETLQDKGQLVNEVTIRLHTTRSLHVGGSLPTGDDPIEGLQLMKPQGVNLSGPAALVTGKITMPIAGDWNSNGRIAARNIYPLPVTITGVAPSGFIPLGGL